MSVTHVAPWKVTRRPRLWDCRICSSTRFGHEGLVQRAGRALRPFVVFETKLGLYNMQELGPPCSDLIGTRRCGAFITATPPSLRSDDTLRPLWQQSYLGKTFGDNLDNIVKAFTRNSWRLSLVHLKRQLSREPSENSQTTFDFFAIS